MSRQWWNDEHTGLREYSPYRGDTRSDPKISPLTRGARCIWAAIGRVLAAVFNHETAR